MTEIYEEIAKLSDKFRSMAFGLTSDENEVNELIEFYKYVQKIEMDKFKSKSRTEIKQKAYTSLTLLIYNLDETTQKS